MKALYLVSDVMYIYFKEERNIENRRTFLRIYSLVIVYLINSRFQRVRVM